MLNKRFQDYFHLETKNLIDRRNEIKLEEKYFVENERLPPKTV